VLVKYGNLLIYVVGADGDQIVTTYEGFVLVKHKEAAEDYIVPDDQAVNIIERAKAAAITAEASAQIAEAAAAEAMSGTPEGYAALVDTVETLSDTDNLTVGTARQLLSDSYQLDTEPYTFRRSGGGLSIGDREADEIIGGSLVWNQLLNVSPFITQTANGCTVTNNNDGSFTFVTDEDGVTQTSSFVLYSIPNLVRKDHKYYITGLVEQSTNTYRFSDSFNAVLSYPVHDSGILNASGNGRFDLRLTVYFGYVNTTPVTVKPRLIDLTTMFGPTVANAIYAMEQATAGAGVAYFRSLFPNDYYEYDPGTLRSVEGVSAHTMRDADNNIIASYPLDASLTLRGVPKWVDGKLVYDGDRYMPDGTVERRYGIRAYQSGDESLTDALTDGTNTVYKLTTATTETAQPYQEIQQVDPDGTEEYVTTGIIPVGHQTKYFEDLKGKLESLPSIPEPPTTDGNYTLKATVSDGAVAYTWESAT
jgi:hypothetical protein